MNKKYSLIPVGIALITFLTACQSAGSATPAGFAGPGAGRFTPDPAMLTQIASDPEMQTRIASGRPGGFVIQGGQLGQAEQGVSPTATVEPSATPTPEPTATATPQANAAVLAGEAYFAALESSDFASAAELVSGFSLMAAKQTAGDVVAALTEKQSQGAAWSNLKVVDSQIFDEKTVLVHVTYRLASKDSQTGKALETAVDELWPFRLENRQWRYNWMNIIDFETLGTAVQQTGGLTMKPLQMIRYTDKIRLVMLAQNGTNQTIVIGRPNQILATFHFGNQSVDSVLTRYRFDPWRGYTDIYIDAPGLFEEYPDAVEIVRYVDKSVAPWFTFGLVD